MNSILVLKTYRYNGMWVFDDDRVGLVREALIAGCPEILEALHAEHKINDPDNGFNLIFSPTPFPGYQCKGEWVKADEEFGGNWYRAKLPNGNLQDAWLCPALYKYFPEAPKELYIRVESIQPPSHILSVLQRAVLQQG
jgi:hypothetical protein